MALENNQILSLAFALGSITLNIIVIFYLIERKTSYSQLMRKIMIYECLLLYSRTLALCSQGPIIDEVIFKTISNMINILLFGKDNDFIPLMKRLNNSINLSSECVLFLLNSFLCYELLSIIKYPISQKKDRIIIYDITAFAIIGTFVFLYFLDLKSKLLFQIAHFITLVIFLAFVVMGILSIIFLVIHFFKEKNETHNARKLFVIKHLLYVGVYLLSFSFTLVTITIALFKSEFDFNFEGLIVKQEYEGILSIALYCNCSIGIILFPIRLLETQLMWKCSCSKQYGIQLYDSNKPEKSKSGLLSSYITRNINLEMICCILYGMNKMFRRNSQGNASVSNRSINNSSSNSNPSSNISSRASSANHEKNLLNKSLEEAKAHKIKYKQIFNINNNIIKSAINSRKTLMCRTSYESQANIDDESSLINSFDIKDIQILFKDNDAVIIEYYPYIFNVLRSEDDITNDMIKDSLNPDNNADFFQSLVESKGKSGSFFFFSSDNKFIIKTVLASELKTINQGFLINYYNHLINNQDTLIAKIYGIYTIVINEISMIHVILMQNLVNCKSEYVKYIFDIKGSTFQRKIDHFANRSNLSPLKDLDFLWMKQIDGNLVSLGDDAYNEILTRIEIDTEMLKKSNLMDYSLLFVIIELPNENDENYLDIIGILGDRRYCAKTFKGKKMNYLYVFGIIDYLQEFNYYKSFELKIKSLLYWKDKNNVSVQPPYVYAQRFVDFVKSNFR